MLPSIIIVPSEHSSLEAIPNTFLGRSGTSCKKQTGGPLTDKKTGKRSNNVTTPLFQKGMYDSTRTRLGGHFRTFPVFLPTLASIRYHNCYKPAFQLRFKDLELLIDKAAPHRKYGEIPSNYETTSIAQAKYTELHIPVCVLK